MVGGMEKRQAVTLEGKLGPDCEESKISCQGAFIFPHQQ